MNPTIGFILIVVLAVILDYAFVRWRHRNKPKEPGAETAPKKQPFRGLPLNFNFAQLTPWRIALGGTLLIFGQLALLRQDGLVAAASLIVALLLLVPTLRELVPGEETYLAPVAETPVALEPPPTVVEAAPQRWTLKMPSPVADRMPSLWRTWRYYTLSNLINGTPPDIPPEVLAELAKPKASPVKPEIVTTTTETTTIVPPTATLTTEAAPEPQATTPIVIEPVPQVPTAEPTAPAIAPVTLALTTEAAPTLPAPPIAPPVSATAPTPPASARATRVMAVSPQGEVIVIDLAHKLLHRFDANGQPLKHIKVDGLPPALTANDLTFSPDGNTLYIFDAASESLRTVSLV